VDFVNVAGLHWKGRDQVVQVQLLRPDVALARIEWETRGDLDFDLKPWPPRQGIFSWVMVKNGAGWRIRSVRTPTPRHRSPGKRRRRRRR
jgi:hypothetical protein